MKKRRSQLLWLVINGKTANTLGFTMARERRLIEGKAILEAAVEAARDRLRPILMTSFAFILGVVPLVIATGAGAEMRQALGTAVFFGMLGVTVFGLLFTPVFYLLVRWIGTRKPASGAVSTSAAASAQGETGG